MKRYTVAHVRERLADVLDEAEQGNPVVIERRGVRYVLAIESAPQRRSRRSAIETLDPAIGNGQWQWTLTGKGVRFSGRRRSSFF